MDTLLILLGVLGFGAIIIAIHVFSVGTDSSLFGPEREDVSPPAADTAHRRPGDRRSRRVVTFPLLINGKLVAEDRRILPDRRRSI